MTMLPDTRGQTLHDFAIGMTIFLLILGYVFAFVPGLFTPFSPDADATTVRADRTAALLTADALAENDSSPGQLNATCTVAFFDESASVPADCRFADADLWTVTGLPERTGVNVTVRRAGSIASYPDDDGTALARGPSPDPNAERGVRAVRIVTLDGTDYRFEVRIWSP